MSTPCRSGETITRNQMFAGRNDSTRVWHELAAIVAAQPGAACATRTLGARSPTDLSRAEPG